MAAAAILDFQICEISFADSVWKAQTHHCAECHQNQSFLCRDITFFWNFQNGYCRHVGFLKSRNFISYCCRGSRHISVLNFIKIGRSVAKILRSFLIILDDDWRHLQLLNLQNFIGWRCPEGPDASLYQILWKSVVPLQRYCDFSNFHFNWIFEIAKFYWLLGWRGSRCISVPILSKLVNRLQRYYNFSIFQDGGRTWGSLSLCKILLWSMQ